MPAGGGRTVVVLLDTATLPPRERNDALAALISEASGPTRVSHDVPDALIGSATQFWTLGPRNGIIRTSGTGMRLSRTPREERAEGPERFALSFQHAGNSVYFEPTGAITHGPGEIYLQNVARSYEYAFDGAVDNSSFLMSHEDLGLPVSVVVEAAGTLRSSPLYRLVQGHLARLGDIAEGLSGNNEAAALLAETTIQLTRALVASTSVRNRASRDVLQDARFTTILAYVRQNLRDPGLHAAKIAADNHISVRQLYKLWGSSDENLHDWILRERLEQARLELAAPASVRVTIEVVARRWGFVDPSHFSRRFRAAYGSSPREWRMAQSAPIADPPEPPG